MNHDLEITLEELHELVRSKATRTPAKEFGLSDIGRAVRRNRSGRLRSRLREEDEPNRQERGTGSIKAIVSKACSTNRLFVFCFCDRPLLFSPFQEFVGYSSQWCHRRGLLERFGSEPLNFGISWLRIVRQLELGWTAKPDLACRRLGHSVEPACGYNLATACEQAHFPGLEQFSALSNFAPVERLDL
jgi:hypothetical protein